MRINKAIASAIMSEAALYAASPLNNDGSISWADASEICKTSLDDCVRNGYALFTTAPSTSNNENLISNCAYDLLSRESLMSTVRMIRKQYLAYRSAMYGNITQLLSSQGIFVPDLVRLRS